MNAKIELSEAEIKQAVARYVESQGWAVDGAVALRVSAHHDMRNEVCGHEVSAVVSVAAKRGNGEPVTGRD